MRNLSWTALALACAAGVAAPAAAGPALTLYSRDLGFVRETRAFERGAGRDTLRLADLPERLDFASLRVAPADAAARVASLARRSPDAAAEAVIEASLGRRVRVTSRGDRVTEGVLVSADGAWLLVRGDDGSLSSVARGVVETLRLPDPPAGLAARPVLEIVLEGGRPGRATAELSYLTGGLSWSAEHVVVRRAGGRAEWSSGVVIENASGVGWAGAEVKLVAGEPRREGSPVPAPRGAFLMEMAAAKADGAAMSEEAFADYHLYTLDGAVTLRPGEQRSVPMHAPRAVKASPRYRFRGGDPRGVAVQLVVANTRAAGLGVPLPAGRVRFFEEDASGALQFTGETRIRHTAEAETLTLDVGSAFDLVAERRDLFSRRVSDREREYGVEVALRNRKTEAVTIVLEEPAGGDVEVLQSTHPLARRDAATLSAEIPVPAGREVLVRYTARVRY